MKDFIFQQIENVLEGRAKEIEKVILGEAVVKFNSTPEIGEEFNLEKHNHANRMLNEMSTFIYKRILEILSK
jgi:hypothetical protein